VTEVEKNLHKLEMELLFNGYRVSVSTSRWKNSGDGWW
jgi:hypothetical protein